MPVRGGGRGPLGAIIKDGKVSSSIFCKFSYLSNNWAPYLTRKLVSEEAGVEELEELGVPQMLAAVRRDATNL
mgnify:CR=1 FL=1